jgi:hypothetical protein
MYPHRIRLRGPWEYELVAESSRLPESLPARGRMTMPCRWGQGGLPGYAGRVCFRRSFSWPGRLEVYERLWLTFAGIHAAAEVWLNGQALGRQDQPGPFEFEVTSIIRLRNEMVVEVEAPDDSGGLWGEIALEVRCTAFLRHLRAWVSSAGEGAHIHVAGELIGTADRPLELYVLHNRSTILYAVLETEPSGSRTIDLRSDELHHEQLNRDPNGQSKTSTYVQVELVNGGVVWFSQEEPLQFARDAEA